MKIHETTPACVDYNDYNINGAHYFRDTLLYVQFYSGSVRLTDLTNAMKPGKKCLSVKFEEPWQGNYCDVANLFRTCGYHFPTLFKRLADSGAPQPYQHYDLIEGDW